MMKMDSVFVFIHKAQSSPARCTQEALPHPQLLQAISADMTTGTFCCLGFSLGHDGGDALEEKRGALNTGTWTREA